MNKNKCILLKLGKFKKSGMKINQNHIFVHKSFFYSVVCNQNNFRDNTIAAELSRQTRIFILCSNLRSVFLSQKSQLA